MWDNVITEHIKARRAGVEPEGDNCEPSSDAVSLEKATEGFSIFQDYLSQQNDCKPDFFEGTIEYKNYLVDKLFRQKQKNK